MEIVFLIILILVAISLPRPSFPGKISFPIRPSFHSKPPRSKSSPSKPSHNKSSHNKSSPSKSSPSKKIRSKPARSKPAHSKPASEPSFQDAKVPSPTVARDPSVSPRLWQQLNRLTKSETTTRRLIKNLLVKYPDRNGDWCCEKAIYDLTRDRQQG